MKDMYQHGELAETVDAAESSAAHQVEHLADLQFEVVQEVDNGTVTLHLERSIDGINWVQVGANIVETGFAAGAGAVVERRLNEDDAAPEQELTKWIRLRASAHAGTGEYQLRWSGRMRHGFAV